MNFPVTDFTDLRGLLETSWSVTAVIARKTVVCILLLEATMGRAKTLTIGDETFRTRKGAEGFIKVLLNAQPLKTAIPEPHHSFLCSLISRHPRAAETIGPGIQHFTVEFAVRGTRCFCLTRVDGSKVDFSYVKCVRGRE